MTLKLWGGEQRMVWLVSVVAKKAGRSQCWDTLGGTSDRTLHWLGRDRDRAEGRGWLALGSWEESLKGPFPRGDTAGGETASCGNQEGWARAERQWV